VRIRSRSTSANPPRTAIIKRPVLVPVSAHGSASDRNWASASTICLTMKAALHHVRRSCDLSSLTNSAAHSRASGIFSASLKARAFAKAWLSADRSAADSFPDRAPRALRVAADTVRIANDPTVQLDVGASTAMSIRAGPARGGHCRGCWKRSRPISPPRDPPRRDASASEPS
jgi:hypothetical protein